ncbi:TRAP transporter large permease [Martelella mediterranea]|uniref:TRAP transporter large permease protein n=1 Tax=Martelella mediterranea TaxID=293089 RepID=A0A4R3NGH0_9HYPH|nr:TRAP transporter large permease [Martelella mediterranea]TCT32670.1 tripartite ATP-independent transporter DctM subunit [Martelella mediterranea]
MANAADIGLILLLSIPILLMIGVPISVSMGIGSVLAMATIFTFDRMAITSAQRIFAGINSFSLLAIPFFILAGNIMTSGGIARRLINFAKALICFIPGSLMQTNIVANMLFGAISGSGVAAAAAIGGAMGPQQKADGYDPKVSAAANIASAPAGMLIPPSNTFIIYSLASGGSSVAALFMAGYIPGILWGIACMIPVVFFARKAGYKSERLGSFKENFRITIEAIPALMMIVIVVGGIISGIFTPTEASAIAVVYVTVLSLAYRTMSLKMVPDLLLATVKTTAMIIFMIGVSSIMGWIMAYAQIPNVIASSLLSITDNPILIMIIMNIVILLLGFVMDPTPAILIFAPIFLPIATSLGVDPVHFGVLMVFNLCIGTITPPVGPIMFVGCRIAELKIEEVVKPLLPFFFILVALLMAVTFIPELSLALPRAAGLIQ